eukprot:PRCOL_00002507-RA
MAARSTGGGAAAAALANLPPIALRDGSQHPAVGFGTYKVGFIPASASAAAAGAEASGATQRTARECVADALSVGYRFLDCAEFYGNEVDVGAAIADSGVAREDLYLASKCWNTTIASGRAAVRACVERTLSDLGIASIDLYCVHWPVPGHHVDAYKELLALRDEGLITSVGVSNYTVEDVDELAAAGVADADMPCINQIEVNPLLFRQRTLDAMRQRGIVVQSYRSLRDGKAFDNETICAIGAKHDRTAAQVMGRWLVQKGIVYIPKSVRRARMEENACVADFELDADDVAALDALTTEEAISTYAALYRKCVFRDTPMEGQQEGLRADFTMD